ncbi:MAG: CDP-alcohol phosphatidyltransferase family protein [Elusimicrobiales bacterium]|nr:CDP-alcohol phosphatidyltransferase family protein [Elusimicrobiales bacterium]
MSNRRLDPLIDRAFAPLGPALTKAGVTPNQLTMLGVVLSFVGAAVLASGRLRAGILILAFTWLFDVLDGALAKYSGQVSRFGGFLDSVMDRYTEGAVFVAFAYYYAAAGNPLMAGVTVFALIGAAAVSYARSRAENEIDGKCDVGVGARLPRLVILAVTTLAGCPSAGIVVVLALSHYTVLQRIVYTRRMLRHKIQEDT